MHYDHNIAKEIIKLIRLFSNSIDTNPPNPSIPDASLKKGYPLDIKITNEHQESFWTTGTICRIQHDKV